MDYFSLRSTDGTAGHDNSEFAHLCLSILNGNSR